MEDFIVYKKQIAKYPILTEEEENLLILDFLNNKSTISFNKIIQSYLRLVASIVDKYYKNKFNISIMDLISSGNVGLLIALRKFDLTKGVKFATYAHWWIISKIQEFISSNISIVKQNQKNTHQTLFTSNKSESILPDISLDQKAYENSDVTILDTLSSNEINQEEFMIYEEEQRRNQALINSIWKTLKDREKYIVYHRFIAEKKKTFSEIGEEFGISTERVRQIEARVKKYMKEVITGKILLQNDTNLIENNILALDFNKNLS